MFRGISSLTVDAKGRMAMPKHHRDRLEADGITGLMITRDSNDCLLIYPMSAWVEIEKKLMALPNSSNYAKAMLRMFIGHAQDISFDSNGRILLPAKLREIAGIGKKAVLLGQGNKFELWSEERFEDASEQWPDEINNVDADQVPEAFKQISF